MLPRGTDDAPPPLVCSRTHHANVSVLASGVTCSDKADCSKARNGPH